MLLPDPPEEPPEEVLLPEPEEPEGRGTAGLLSEFSPESRPIEPKNLSAKGSSEESKKRKYEVKAQIIINTTKKILNAIFWFHTIRDYNMQPY